MKILFNYILNILVAIDQFLNVLAFGATDETISSRLGRNYPNSSITKMVNFLFFWEINHCQNRIEPEDRTEDRIFKGL